MGVIMIASTSWDGNIKRNNPSKMPGPVQVCDKCLVMQAAAKSLEPEFLTYFFLGLETWLTESST